MDTQIMMKEMSSSHWFPTNCDTNSGEEHSCDDPYPFRIFHTHENEKEKI